MGASVGYVDTDLWFPNGVTASLRESSAGASFSWRASERFTISASAGALVGGALVVAGPQTLALRPGPFAAITGTMRVLDGTNGWPFLTASVGLSGLWATTVDVGGVSAPYTAIDLKASAIVGMTFFERFSPYVGASIFGGPVFWGLGSGLITGTDTHHYQVLLGASVALPAGIDLFVEGSPLGERTISGGAGLSF